MKRMLANAIWLGLLATSAAGQVTQQWVARYHGLASDTSEATALAFDSRTGNVYVTGTREHGTFGGRDYTTVAYNASGNQWWASSYAFLGSNSYDLASAIAVDNANGNVYVTGESYSGVGSRDDYATVAYDSSGNQLWVARYNGTVNGMNIAHAIAVDSTTGNVYVTGESYGGVTSGIDYATVAYDSRGNQLWAARYHGPGTASARAFAIAVDCAGNVYVTGSSDGGASGFDYATVAYDSSGNQLWVARYNGPGNSADNARAIAVDSAGNVYVTGESARGASADYVDYATVAYDSSGNQLWVARYTGPVSSIHYARAIAVDGMSNVYVTGESTGASTVDYATVAYDSSGNQLWVARYHGPGSGDYYNDAVAIAVDSASNVYVTGKSDGGASGPDYGTVAYDANGNLLWAASYNGPGNSLDEARSIAVDSATGDVYVTGRSRGGGSEFGLFSYATIKYSQP